MLPPFLPPPGACKFLYDEFGIKRTPATLAKQRVLGGNSPPYHKLNRNIYYAVAELRNWANAELSGHYRTTSDRGPASNLLAHNARNLRPRGTSANRKLARKRGAKQKPAPWGQTLQTAHDDES